MKVQKDMDEKQGASGDERQSGVLIVRNVATEIMKETQAFEQE